MEDKGNNPVQCRRNSTLWRSSACRLTTDSRMPTSSGQANGADQRLRRICWAVKSVTRLHAFRPLRPQS